MPPPPPTPHCIFNSGTPVFGSRLPNPNLLNRQVRFTCESAFSPVDSQSVEYHNGISHLSQSLTLQTKDNVKPRIDVMILKQPKANAKDSLLDASNAKKKKKKMPMTFQLNRGSPAAAKEKQEKLAIKKKAKRSWRTISKVVNRPDVPEKVVVATGSFKMDACSGSTHVNLTPSVRILRLHSAAFDRRC